MDKIYYIGKCLLVDCGKKIIVIGDLHLGYEEVLNRGGVFVSRQMFGEMISYLEKVFEKIGFVEEVVLLGDVKHEFGRVIRQEWKDLGALLTFLEGRCGKIIVVRGNHDKILEYAMKEKKINILDYYIDKKFCFLHGDREFEEISDKKIKYWIVGHAHPAIKISDGVKVEKYKCFLVGKYKGKKIIIVPSFVEANEGSDPRENDLGLAWDFNLNKFEVRVVSGEELKVLDFGVLEKI